jgi:uncharacterized membrane protein
VIKYKQSDMIPFKGDDSMNTRIRLKFQKLHVVTTLGWATLLFLALISRGVLTQLVFWLIVVMISVLFILDGIYFVIRVIEGHYLLITNHKVVLKRFLKPIASISIAKIQSIVFINGEHKKRLILSDGETEVVIKHEYKFKKENILRSIQESSNYPKHLDVTNK